MENEISFDVPILFVLFNRPDHARQVLNRFREIKPTRLYVTIDGPRVDKPQDVVDVQKCIDLLKEVDWNCTVTKLIRNENLGCKTAVSSAISWFFGHVEAGIILEDDCLPDPTFFSFCDILLRKYANETKVMHIGGANLYGNIKWGSYAYFFSCIPHIWGWATWRRAWVLYDVDMKDYPRFKQSGGIYKAVSYPASRSFWEKIFNETYSGNINTWDYQWVFTIWKNQGLSIIPNQNLISNIGFGDNATHTYSNSEFANLPTIPIDINTIIYPNTSIPNKDAVKYAFAKFYQLPSLWEARINRLKNILFMRKSGLFNFIIHLFI